MMQGKVALEEHVVLPSMAAPGAVGSPADTNDPDYYADVRRRMTDAGARLEDMDRYGIETMVLSLSQPGVVDTNLVVGGTQISTVAGPGATNAIPGISIPVASNSAAQALTQVKFTTNAGTVAGAVIKASGGNFYAVTINNPNGSICFLEIFNATTGQVPGTAVANIVIPATASFTFSLIPYSENFATGIAFTGATAADGATGCTSAMTGTAWIR